MTSLLRRLNRGESEAKEPSLSVTTVDSAQLSRRRLEFNLASGSSKD